MIRIIANVVVLYWNPDIVRVIEDGWLWCAPHIAKINPGHMLWEIKNICHRKMCTMMQYISWMKGSINQEK